MIKVGIISGGPSAEHDVSLRTGKEVFANLPVEKYSGKDIFLSKNGEWVFEGKFSNPEKIFRSVDVIFNALHGAFGEDGKVQQLMEMFGIPYTGSGVMASALGMNKSLSKESFKNIGLNVPVAMIIDNTDGPIIAAKKVFSRIGPPWMIKPVSGGSSLGNFIARNFHELAPVLENAFDFSDNLLVEEFIKGKEATCGVIENFRNSEHYALPVTEIVYPSKNFFNYEAKYGDGAEEICPARFSLDLKKEIESAATEAHRAIGCRHYSRSDFIITPKNKIYILEINTLPGLTKESLLPKKLEAVGASYGEFLDHIITLALSEKR